MRAWLLGMFWLGLPAAAMAAQNPDAVTAAVRQAVATTVPADATITLGPVQGAQYMQPCAKTLQVKVTGNPPYEQASVVCPQPAWTLYITVTIAAQASVVVAARPITAGQMFAPADLAIRRVPVAAFAGRQVFYSAAALSGATAVLSFAPGTILTPSDVSTPVIVQAGQTVSVDVRSQNLDISVNAIADQSGRVGETIQMTNKSSGQHFSALVTAAGLLVQLN